MKWFNDYRMRLVFVGIVAGIVFSVGSAKADFTFGEPENLGPTINSGYGDAVGFISSDGLEFYFASSRPPAGNNAWKIWVSTRASIDDEWGPPINPGSPLNTSYHEEPLCISNDGLVLYIDSSRPGGSGREDLWVAKRKSKKDAWEAPVNLGPRVNSSAHDFGAWISTDGLELYYNSARAGGHGGHDIYVVNRTTTDSEWGTPRNLGANVNSSTHDMYPTTSDNGLLLLFSDYPGAAPRPGGFGNGDIWMIKRMSASDPWGEPVNIGPLVNSNAWDGVPRISPDCSKLYFSSTRPGGYGGPWGDIYQAPIIPIVDLNGDGIVDASDMCIVVDHWGEDYSLCDIGPTPFGDGIVDVEDLKILAEHLFEEVDDPTLLAHWKLDEEEGKTAYDSVGTNDGVIIGLPQWRPQDGAVDGALELNGTTFIAFNPVLNPADGPFSMLVWIKGGGPGQVIASSGRINWLIADAATGALMTELSNVGQNGGSPGQEAVITDGNWHRIAFTWDGANARLYVDTLLVAEYAQGGLVNSSARLLLGTSMDREPGTYWSGLIDDIRIYNRVVSP